MLRFWIVLGLAILSLTFSAHTAVAQSDFYVFGALGHTDADVRLTRQNRVDDADSSYTLGAGYAFTEHVSLEGAYHDFGAQDARTNCPPGFFCLAIPLFTEADLTAFSLSLVGSVSLRERLDLYGRFGLTRWDIEFAGISSAFNDSGEDLHYGAGLRWSIDDHWKFFGEYTAVDLDLGTVSIGVRYDF